MSATGKCQLRKRQARYATKESVPGSERCADALLARHASAQSTTIQSLVAKDERSRSGLTTPSIAGAPRAQHAHALESELSMLTGGVSYCRFSFHGGVKHVLYVR